MCVLLVKPANTPVPAKDIIEACCKANPDGFGFATPTRYFRTMDKDEFIKECMSLAECEPAIIHMRWATHGSKRTDNCHPFFDEETGTYFAHNGILPFYPKGDITDSEFAFRTFIVPSVKAHGFDSRSVAYSCSRIIGTSKFALLNGSKVRMFGHFEKIEGVYFSNLRWASMLKRPLWDLDDGRRWLSA